MINIRLHVLLAERRMSMQELAEASGVHYQTVLRYNAGKLKNVSLATLDAFCKALDVEPGDILTYEPDPD